MKLIFSYFLHNINYNYFFSSFLDASIIHLSNNFFLRRMRMKERTSIYNILKEKERERENNEERTNRIQGREKKSHFNFIFFIL